MNKARVNEKYLYKQIEEYIMEGIQNETFPEGALLPTEKELCEMFDCSRMTVNKALNRVVENNYIERIQGSGSFVKLPDLEKDIVTMTSFTEQQYQKGVYVSTKLISYTVVPAKKFSHLRLAKQLCINPEDMVHYFARLRYGNGKPIAFQYTYVPVCRVPHIDINSLSKSFYEYLEKKMKIALGNGKSSLRIELPSEEVAKYLQVSEGQPVVYVNHVSCLKNGLPLEYVDTYNVWNGYMLNFYNKRDL